MKLPAVALLPLLAGCFAVDSGDKRPDASAPAGVATTAAVTSSGAGADAFGRTVYPLIATHCASCHGVNQSPRFAVPPASNAYSVVMSNRLASSSDYLGSRLLAKRTDGHCGAYCRTDGSDFRAALAEWAAAEAKADVPAPQATVAAGSVALPAQTIAADLPTGTTFRAFTWDLTASGFNGAKLMIEVQVLTGTNAYQLRRPTLTLPANAGYSIYLRGLSVRINGIEDRDATTFSLIDRIISPPGGQTLSPAAMIVLQVKGPGSDAIAPVIGSIEKAPGTCKSVTTFASNVRPVMAAKCISCHATQAVFSMAPADSDAVVCSRALQRVDFANAPSSPIITLPRFRANRRNGTRHDTTTMDDTDVASFLSWIAAEAR